MIKKALRLGFFGALAMSVVACGTPATLQSGQAPEKSADAPLVDLPMQASEADLVAPQRLASDFETQQWGWRGGRRYRFRRVIIGAEPYYVPYYYPTTYPYYVPYYTYYDPSFYYVPAYSAPYFGSRSVIVRYGRRDRRFHRY